MKFNLDGGEMGDRFAPLFECSPNFPSASVLHISIDNGNTVKE